MAVILTTSVVECTTVSTVYEPTHWPLPTDAIRSPISFRRRTVPTAPIDLHTVHTVHTPEWSTTAVQPVAAPAVPTAATWRRIRHHWRITNPNFRTRRSNHRVAKQSVLFWSGIQSHTGRLWQPSYTNWTFTQSIHFSVANTAKSAKSAKSAVPNGVCVICSSFVQVHICHQYCVCLSWRIQYLTEYPSDPSALQRTNDSNGNGDYPSLLCFHCDFCYFKLKVRFCVLCFCSECEPNGVCGLAHLWPILWQLHICDQYCVCVCVSVQNSTFTSVFATKSWWRSTVPNNEWHLWERWLHKFCCFFYTATFVTSTSNCLYCALIFQWIRRSRYHKFFWLWICWPRRATRGACHNIKMSK